MIPRRYLLIGLGAVLAILAGLVGVDSCRGRQGANAEHQAAVHQGEANTHASQAQAVPDHSQELADAKAAVARARAEVERVKRLLAAKPGDAVPDPSGSSQTLPPVVDPDPRDAVIASQGVLIEKQDGQIQALQVALMDEQKRSEQWKAAFESERRRSEGLQIALDAQKHVAANGKWVGRLQGFAIGIGTGYVAGRIR